MAGPGLPGRMNGLCCGICRESLRDRASLSCGHSFCRRCLQEQWDRDERKQRPSVCPECGHKFSSRPQLITHTTPAEAVTDTQRSDGRKRKQQHSEGPPQEDPKRPGSCSGTPGSALCWRHDRPLDVYCCTDEQIICDQCTAEHRGHSIGCVTEERRIKQGDLKIIQTKFKKVLQKQQEKLEDMEKRLKQIQEEARQAEDYCEGVIVQVIDSLQRHYLSVRELIGAQEEAAAAQVHASLQTLQVKMEEMKKEDADLDRLAQTENDVEFLQKWISLRTLFKKSHVQPLHEVSVDPPPSFEFTKGAVKELGRKLQKFCDKEFALISQSADGGEQQEAAGETETEEEDMQEIHEANISPSCGLSEVDRTPTEQRTEPKTREEFLIYACDLSLDPTTAHQDLDISNGDRQVMLCHQKSRSSSDRNPQRFIHRRQVLCREGLQAERCYYEVEVKGDKAEIALAYIGIDRKSRTTLSAFGAKANSWSLDRSTNYSVSHAGGSVQLTTSPSHHKIGVYLKFKEGTLSFYEVSDSMKFLYKIEAEFTEPLFPGFWLGENCCIRICDLTHRRL